MSFTNDRAKDIDRENKILLKKIMRTKTSITNSQNHTSTTPRVCSATVTRRRAEEKINHDNLVYICFNFLNLFKILYKQHNIPDTLEENSECEILKSQLEKTMTKIYLFICSHMQCVHTYKNYK